MSIQGENVCRSDGSAAFVPRMRKVYWGKNNDTHKPINCINGKSCMKNRKETNENNVPMKIISEIRMYTVSKNYMFEKKKKKSENRFSSIKFF